MIRHCVWHLARYPPICPFDVDAKIQNERIVKEGSVFKKYSLTLQLFNQSRMDYRIHAGVDIKAAGEDKGVYAAFSGKVIEVSGER